MSETMNGEQLESENEDNETKESSIFNQIIIGFITISIFYINSLLTVSSTHLASVFSIQPNNVCVYISKLNTYRGLLTLLGTIVYGIISTHVYQQVGYLSLVSLGLLTLVRLILVIVLYVSKRLALHIYIVLVVEAFVFGVTHLSIVVSYPQYTSTIILATHISGLLIVIIEFIFSVCIKNALNVFRIQCWICLIFSMGSVGLWYYYLKYFYERFPKSYYKITDEIDEKVGELTKKVDNEIIDFVISEKLIQDIIDSQNNILSFKSDTTNIEGNILEDYLISKILSYITSGNPNRSRIENIIKSNYSDPKIRNFENDIEIINESINSLNKRTSKIVKEIKLINNEITDLELKQFKEKIKSAYKQIKNLISLTAFFTTIDTRNLSRQIIEINSKIEKISGIVDSLNPLINEFKNTENKKVNELKQKLKELNSEINKLQSEIEENDEEIINYINQFFMSSFSPFFMILVALLFKDFLYPRILPQAILDNTGCYKINLAALIFSIISSLAIFILDNNFGYNDFQTYINISWILILPQFIVFVFTLLSIHSKSMFNNIINSSLVVMLMTMVLITCFGLVESVSYVGITNYVYYQSLDVGNNLKLLFYYVIAVLFCQLLFSKLSSGYNTTRVKLGYVFPDFNSESSLRYGFCYWFTQTLKYTVVDTISDLRFNIRNYT